MKRYTTGRFTAFLEDGQPIRECRAVRAESADEAYRIFAGAGYQVSHLTEERDVNAEHTEGDLIEWYRLSDAAYAIFDVFTDGKIPAKAHGNIMNGLYDKGLVTSTRSRFALLTRAGWLLAAAYADEEGAHDLAAEYRETATRIRRPLPLDL